MTRKMQDEEDDGGGGRVQRGNEPRDWGLTGRKKRKVRVRNAKPLINQ